MQRLARIVTPPAPPLAARTTVRHRLVETSNLYYPGQRERAPLWRGMSRSEHVDVAHALVHSLGPSLAGYALTGGEPTLNRPALLELVGYLSSAPVPSFWLETNATLLSGPLLEELHEAGLRQLRVHLPAREPRRYARALGIGEHDARQHLERIEATLTTALHLRLHVALDVPVLRALNDDADTLLGFAPWLDRGLSLTLVPLDTPATRDPLELLQTLGARPIAHPDGDQYELCHDSRCITVSAQRRRAADPCASTLHVAADGRVRAETHDPSPPSSSAPVSDAPASHAARSTPPREEHEPIPPTLRVVAPPLPWTERMAVGF